MSNNPQLLGNEHLPDPQDDWDSDDEEHEGYDYYMCYCCQHSCAEDHGNWGCPKCGAIMQGEYY